MALEVDEKKALREHYRSWGLDVVRQELQRPGRAIFANPEVTEFAHDWVEEEEARKQRQKDRLVKVLMIAAVVECAVILNLPVGVIH